MLCLQAHDANLFLSTLCCWMDGCIFVLYGARVSSVPLLCLSHQFCNVHSSPPSPQSLTNNVQVLSPELYLCHAHMHIWWTMDLFACFCFALQTSLCPVRQFLHCLLHARLPHFHICNTFLHSAHICIFVSVFGKMLL